jgi:hypothetical protein
VVKEVISRCNICGTSVDGVEEFTITIGGETRDVDLCTEDAAPIVAAFEAGAPVEPKTKRGRSSHAVVPIEDL